MDRLTEANHKYTVTYADGIVRTYPTYKHICWQPSDPRDEIIDCKVIYNKKEITLNG